jgi:hypothetical protein
MSGRLVVLSLLLVAFAACQSTAHRAAATIAPVGATSLTCFSATPPDDMSFPVICDELCAKEAAVCTAVQTIVTPSGCDLPAGDMGRCRCCKGAP